MLLILQDEVANVSCTNLPQMESLECILMSVHKGKHFLLTSRKVQKWLSSNNEYFSLPAQGVIKKLKHLITNYGELPKIVDTKIIVGIKQKGFARNMNGTWFVDLGSFQTHNIYDQISLISEHLHDCRVYKASAESYRISKKLAKYTAISCRSILGGGGTTATVFKNEIENEMRITLCIVDSDRKAPSGPVGGTANNCRSVTDRANSIVDLIILEARELENVVPNRLVRDAFLDSDVEFNTIDRMETIGGLDQAFNHVDYKKGTCIQWVNEKLGTDFEAKNFWENLYSRFHNAGIISDPIGFYCAAGDCGKCNLNFYNNCEWVLFRKISNNLVEVVCDFIYSRSLHNLPQYSNCQFSPDWYGLGKVVFEWSLAQPPSKI